MPDAWPRRRLLATSLSVASLGIGGRAWAASGSVTLDYAYYNPLSLIVRDRGLAERELGRGVRIQWVLAEGSNKALEYLRGGSVDIGGAAGAAALLGRANGNTVKAIGIYAEAEWTALVAPATSKLTVPADLKGRSIAATPGTDPYIFLLHVLAGAGLTRRDVTIVPLQHPAGRVALDRRQVDAWAGLDPFMAEAELESHDRLFYRNPQFVSPGVLLAPERVLAARPEVVSGVLRAYEAARRWALANPDATVELLARASRLQPDIARRQLGRTRFPDLPVSAGQRDRIGLASEVLAGSGAVTDPARLKAALASLFA